MAIWHDVLLAPIAVPHFYYQGILLEVDVWWAGSGILTWVTGQVPEVSSSRLAEHLFAPTALLQSLMLAPRPILDPGAVIDGGPLMTVPTFHAIDLPGELVTTDVSIVGDVVMVVRRCGPYAWIQGRATNGSRGLVGQTEDIMGSFDALLVSLGLGYTDVAKSTTHHVGGTSAEDLHDNMAVPKP